MAGDTLAFSPCGHVHNRVALISEYVHNQRSKWMQDRGLFRKGAIDAPCNSFSMRGERTGSEACTDTATSGHTPEKLLQLCSLNSLELFPHNACQAVQNKGRGLDWMYQVTLCSIYVKLDYKVTTTC